jgi:hypothetical protein
MIIPNIEVPAGKTLEITVENSAPANLNIAGKLKGAGTLKVPGEITGIYIAGGDGTVQFSRPAPHTRNPRNGVQIGSTGKVIFDQAVTIPGTSTVPAKIYGDVEFNGNVTANAVALYGNVTLSAIQAPQKTVTFTGTGNLSLGAGKTISVRIRPTVAGSATTIAPVLAAGPGGVVLTPAANAELLVPAPPSKVDGVDAAKKLTLRTAGLTIADGTLEVASGAVFEVNTVILDTYIPNTGETAIGYLAVTDGGTLGLASSGSVDIGNTTITTTSATISAGAGTVSLGNDKIAGSVAGSKLTVVKGNAGFTLNGGVGGGRLTLEQVDFNLITSGTIATSLATDQVELTKRAKIILKDDTGGVATTRGKIGTAARYAALDGDFVGLIAPTATTTQAALSLAHNGGSPVIIKGGVSLSRSGTNFIQ